MPLEQIQTGQRLTEVLHLCKTLLHFVNVAAVLQDFLFISLSLKGQTGGSGKGHVCALPPLYDILSHLGKGPLRGTSLQNTMLMPLCSVTRPDSRG